MDAREVLIKAGRQRAVFRCVHRKADEGGIPVLYRDRGERREGRTWAPRSRSALISASLAEVEESR